MVTTITEPRRTARRSLAVTGCLALVTVIATACGSSEPSADEARDKLMDRLTESGVSAPVATCIVDEALERFEPGELVNTSGQASAEVDAALGDIVVECSTREPRSAATTIPEATDTEIIAGTSIPDTTIPETTVPDTTVPDTTVPDTVPDVDLTAFCVASEDVLIGLLAGDAFEAPAPATMEAFFAELMDRIELAIVKAPTAEFAVQPIQLLAAIQSFDAVHAASGYDVLLFGEEQLADEGDVVASVQAELEIFLENCETGTDIDAEASALASELTALGGAPVPPGDDRIRRSESVDLLISSDVPALWTSELSETVDDRRIFIVATDAERFTTSWGVDGVRFTGLEATVGYVPLMDESDAARECTLAVEEDFENLQYIGKLRRYEGCGEGTEAVVIGANDIDGEGTVVVELQMVEFDPAVLGLIVISFVV